MQPDFLARGRTAVATVEVAAPNPTTDTVGANRGLTASFAMDGADVQGRLSLGMLAALIVASLAFYWWTRTAQGGG